MLEGSLALPKGFCLRFGEVNAGEVNGVAQDRMSSRPRMFRPGTRYIQQT